MGSALSRMLAFPKPLINLPHAVVKRRAATDKRKIDKKCLFDAKAVSNNFFQNLMFFWPNEVLIPICTFVN
jgi:hypothetical protein